MPFLDRLREEKLQPEDVGYKKGEEHRLLYPMRYFWERERITFTNEIGDVSDGASIPTIIPDIVLNDHGKLSRPAYPHDKIYWAYRDATKAEREEWEAHNGEWSKRRADLLLRDAARDEGVSWIRRWITWSGVRANLIAAHSWGKNV